MAKKEQRFIKFMEDSGFISSSEVLVDTQTACSISITPWATPAD